MDPTYRVILRDAQGRMLTRKDLQDPGIFVLATGKLPNYLAIYDYQNFAHVRIARLPLGAFGLHTLLRKIYPSWDEDLDWSLLLERESFFFMFVSLISLIFFFLLRLLLAWYARSLFALSPFSFPAPYPARRRHLSTYTGD